MIDEAVLEELFADFADEIPVPPAGPEHVLDAIRAGARPDPRARQFPRKLLAVAAAVVVIGLIGVAAAQSRSSSTNAVARKMRDADSESLLTPANPAKERSLDSGANSFGNDKTVEQSGTVPAARHATAAGGGVASSASTPPAATDGAKIVKTGTLDLQAGHGALRTTVNRVTAAAVGLAGYVSDSKTNYGGKTPTAQITIRVPVNNFEAAITRLEALPGVKVLGESESGSDVTGQYTDLQAQLSAATSERDSLLQVLANARSTGDILAVRDRVGNVQAEINQLQGRINVLDNQATLSALAVTLSEKPVKATTTAAHQSEQSGLAKAWADARQGFSDGIEWLIARSGGALIFLLAALALLFGIRYLYPIVRRGLV